MFYALFNVAMVLVYRDLAIAVCTVSFLLYSGFLVYVDRRLGRWGLRSASTSVGVGLLVQATVIAFAYPDAGRGTAVVPLVMVGLLLPFLQGRRLYWMIVLAGIAALALTVISELVTPWTNSPPWLVMFYRLNAIPATTILVLVLLWQFHRRQMDTLERLRANKRSLETGKAELERPAYAVSHDLKNPLVTMSWYLGQLGKDLGDATDETVLHDLARLEEATHEMTRLASELLRPTRLGHTIGPRVPVNLRAVVLEATESIGRGEGAPRLTVDIDPDTPAVLADGPRLLAVVDNAVKFTEGDEPRLEITATTADGEVVCSIKDHGVGIDPRHHTRIFGLFERLDRTVDGTGVGLAVAKRILEEHGGRIWVESEGPGYGSTFHFALPRSADERGAPSGS